MSLPKAGKVNLKTPQNAAGSPSITSRSGGLPSVSASKIKGPLKSTPGPSAAPRPSTQGRKVSTVIQSGNAGSRTGKK